MLEINGTQQMPISKDFPEPKDQWVYITLNGYKTTVTVPRELNEDQLQAHLESNVDQYLLNIRKKEYPDCPKESKQDLETMEQWIKDGCKIPVVLDRDGKEIKPERIAKKVKWKGKHPGKSLKTRIAELEARVTALEKE